MGVNSSPALGGDGFITTTIESFANWGRKTVYGRCLSEQPAVQLK